MRGATVRSLSRGLGGARAFPSRARGGRAFGSQLSAASAGGAPTGGGAAASGGGGGGWSTAALLTAGAAVGAAAGLAGARLLGSGAAPVPAAADNTAPRFGALAGTPWSEALAAAPGARRVVTGAQLLAEARIRPSCEDHRPRRPNPKP
jgi:type IV secretion system protein TrbL